MTTQKKKKAEKLRVYDATLREKAHLCWFYKEDAKSNY